MFAFASGEKAAAQTRVVFCLTTYIPVFFGEKGGVRVFARTCRSPARKKTWRIGRSLKFLAKMRPPAKRGSRERESAAAAHTIKHTIREKKTRRVAFSADVHALRILCPGIKRTGTGRRRKRKMYKHNKSRRAGQKQAAVKAKQKPVRHRVSSRSSISKRVWDYKFLFGYNCRHKKRPRIDIKGPRLLVKSWTCFLANCWALFRSRRAHQTRRKQQQRGSSGFLSRFGRLAFPSEINSVFTTALLNLRPNCSRQQRSLSRSN